MSAVLQDELAVIPRIVKLEPFAVERGQGILLQLRAGIGDRDLQITQDIPTVKQHLEIHRFRQRINAAIIPVRHKNFGVKLPVHLVKAFHFGQIGHRIADGKFYRRFRADSTSGCLPEMMDSISALALPELS